MMKNDAGSDRGRGTMPRRQDSSTRGQDVGIRKTSRIETTFKTYEKRQVGRSVAHVGYIGIRQREDIH